jgi:hypothetical protein
MVIDVSASKPLRKVLTLPLLFWGAFFFAGGIALYTFGVLLSIPRILFSANDLLFGVNQWIVWYSGVPVMLGILLAAADLTLLLPHKRRKGEVLELPTDNRDLTVVLTAYNDEESIGAAVRDFLAHPLVKRVLVVSNNSSDATMARAAEAGALVVDEPNPGYGRCVIRCLEEGVRFDDTELTLLCEGDRTFRAHDIDKFVAYIPHATIVSGTRIVEQLREYRTQLTTFMYYGNFAVGKLLEVKHIGKGTFTDVGTTYKLCRNDAIRRLLPHLDGAINLEFNAHFLDVALTRGEHLVECPVTFYKRVGTSKGGNTDNLRALAVGTRMILGLLTDWRVRK